MSAFGGKADINASQRIERRDIGPPGAFDGLTDDALERALRERLIALGLTPEAGTDTRH